MAINKNQDILKIIPQPNKIEIKGETLTLDENFHILVSKETENLGLILKKMILPALDLDIEMESSDLDRAGSKIIRLTINDKYENLGEEGYSLKINNDNIHLCANKEAGIFYAIQSLNQLLFPYINSNQIDSHKIFLSCLSIEDYPRFKWRGFMLDEARHFQGREIVKKILDIMALLKLNIFHWHLTDDQGWRIQIKKYPELTEIGSKRTGTQIGGFIGKKIDPTPHEGYYKQDEIQEIIEFAKERYIEIIPEIEMPGHCSAALTTYPALSCTGGPFEIPQTFGIKKDVFCMGKEKVFQFLSEVLDEIIELFPSNIVHIGGDEVPKDRWKECPDCQKRVEEENLEDVKQLQSYFTNRIAKYLSSKGYLTMGWNQIINEKLIDEVIVQYWMGSKKKIRENLENGRKFVMSKFGHVYLDYKYEFTPLRKSYKYEPIPKKLDEKFHEKVLGIEAPLWTEWVPNHRRLFWQVFPRLTAVAETGWTLRENKDYNSFKKRLGNFNKMLRMKGAGHAAMKEIDPPFLKTLFGIFTIFRQPEGEI